MRGVEQITTGNLIVLVIGIVIMYTVLHFLFKGKKR